MGNLTINFTRKFPYIQFHLYLCLLETTYETIILIYLVVSNCYINKLFNN